MFENVLSPHTINQLHRKIKLVRLIDINSPSRAYSPIHPNKLKSLIIHEEILPYKETTIYLLLPIE
jgi:hypothetical protein